MNAIILSVGDELVLGQTVDTNSAWLSQQLAASGCDVIAHATAPDDLPSIERAINDAAPRCDLLLVSGGIGPTADDLTRQALAAVMNAPLEIDEHWLSQLHRFFEHRRRPMPETNRIQAMIPRGAKLIENTTGTAAGIHATLDVRLNRARPPRPCHVFVMPGVPSEMKVMFDRDVKPHVLAMSGNGRILVRTLHTFGLGESVIAERLGELMRRDRNPSVGTTVSAGVVSLRIYARFPSEEQAATELDSATLACRGALGDLIYGQDEETLPGVVGELLAGVRQTVTTAESCTGGLLAKMLTDVAGASRYFNVGFITYSNASKYERLGVPTEMLNLYGAVSEPVVTAMARNARRLAKATFALAVSGVAGPDGGSPAKPVGTVCIALASPDPTRTTDHSASAIEARTFQFPGDREWVRDRAAKMALSMLRYHLLGKAMPF